MFYVYAVQVFFKTLWEMEKLLISSIIFSFSHIVLQSGLEQADMSCFILQMHYCPCNSSPNDKFLNWSKVKEFSEDKLNYS